MYPLYVYLEDVLHMLLFILHLVLCCVLELLIPVKCRRSRMHQIELLKLISISFQVPFKGIYSSNEVKCSQSAVPFYYNFVFKRVRIQCDIRRVKLEVVVHFSMCYIQYPMHSTKRFHYTNYSVIPSAKSKYLSLPIIISIAYLRNTLILLQTIQLGTSSLYYLCHCMVSTRFCSFRP